MRKDLQLLDGKNLSFLDSHASLRYPFHHRYVVEMHRVQQKMDQALLTSAVRFLFTFHDILRLRVAADESTWITPLLPDEPVVWVNIPAASEEEQQQSMRTVMKDIYQTFLDKSEFLSRFVYFHCENSHYDFFCMVIHHILADGYSMYILSHDLLRVYLQLCRNQLPHLAVKTASFYEFTERIRRYLYQEFPAELEHWRSLALRTKPFPVDYPEKRMVN